MFLNNFVNFVAKITRREHFHPVNETYITGQFNGFTRSLRQFANWDANDVYEYGESPRATPTSKSKLYAMRNSRIEEFKDFISVECNVSNL